MLCCDDRRRPPTLARVTRRRRRRRAAAPAACRRRLHTHTHTQALFTTGAPPQNPAMSSTTEKVASWDAKYTEEIFKFLCDAADDKAFSLAELGSKVAKPA